MFIATECVWKCGKCGFSENGDPPPTSNILLFLHGGGCAILVTCLIIAIILMRFVHPAWFAYSGLVLTAIGTVMYAVDVWREKAFQRRRKLRACPQCGTAGMWTCETKGGMI